MANKKKSIKAPVRKKKAAAKKRVAPEKTVTAQPSHLRSLGLTASDGAAFTDSISPLCPTHVYSGVLDLENEGDSLNAFLTIGDQRYLLALDPDCSGVFNADRVTAAYNAFKDDPGPHGNLTCNGFIHTDGTTHVLHVVS